MEDKSTILPQDRSKHPLANYQFSSDELRILQQCNTESFFQRSLPLGTGIGVATYFGVKNGYLQPNVKYGAVPKIVVGVIIGYFLGKFSYQQKCAEKLMRLPNSKLADILRQRRQDGGFSNLKPDKNLGFGLALSPFTSETYGYSDEQQSENTPNTTLNLDPESRPILSGLDDIYRPTLDAPSTFFESDIPVEPVKPGVTYEELRNRNREAYKHGTAPLSVPAKDPYAYERKPKTSLNNDEEANKREVQRNKYGDTWID